MNLIIPNKLLINKNALFKHLKQPQLHIKRTDYSFWHLIKITWNSFHSFVYPRSFSQCKKP